MTMPAVFVGHGNPMNAVTDNAYRRGWAELGKRLPKPKAILCVSAHWDRPGPEVTSNERPETIHDFGGFPQELFDVEYPAPGAPELAQEIAELVEGRTDETWGIDHGTWSVLVAMYPKAEIPVLQLSLDTRRDGAWHLELARKLAPLREKGVLVMGSGNIVHNLRLFSFRPRPAYDWAERFHGLVKGLIVEGNVERLADLESLPDAELAAPTPEHYLPLLFPLALRREGEKVAFFNEEVESAMDMTGVVVG